MGLQNAFPGTAKSSKNRRQHEKRLKFGTKTHEVMNQRKLNKMLSFFLQILPLSPLCSVGKCNFIQTKSQFICYKSEATQII